MVRKQGPELKGREVQWLRSMPLAPWLVDCGYVFRPSPSSSGSLPPLLFVRCYVVHTCSFSLFRCDNSKGTSTIGCSVTSIRVGTHYLREDPLACRSPLSSSLPYCQSNRTSQPSEHFHIAFNSPLCQPITLVGNYIPRTLPSPFARHRIPPPPRSSTLHPLLHPQLA